MRILVALGGSALSRSREPPALAAREESAAAAAAALAGLAGEHEIVLAQGRETVGCLELALRNALPERDVVSVLSQVVVDGADPAFAAPSQPVGPVYAEAEARRLAAERGWRVGPDGDGFRRLVAAPDPRAIAELASLRVLIDAGALVICVGGGTPVAVGEDGEMRGVEAAIERDLTAALLARRLEAEMLLLLTDVDAVRLGWGTAEERPLRGAVPAELRSAEFASGSMGPKVEAACRFVEATGRRAAIGSLEQALAVVRRQAGTQVEAEPRPVA